MGIPGLDFCKFAGSALCPDIFPPPREQIKARIKLGVYNTCFPYGASLGLPCRLRQSKIISCLQKKCSTKSGFIFQWDFRKLRCKYYFSQSLIFHVFSPLIFFWQTHKASSCPCFMLRCFIYRLTNIQTYSFCKEAPARHNRLLFVNHLLFASAFMLPKRPSLLSAYQILPESLSVGESRFANL
jgi:hypothetical protein